MAFAASVAQSVRLTGDRFHNTGRPRPGARDSPLSVAIGGGTAAGDRRPLPGGDGPEIIAGKLTPFGYDRLLKKRVKLPTQTFGCLR
jgi:hypothetical protein